MHVNSDYLEIPSDKSNMNTRDLIGPALDWAVAMCRGFEGMDEDQWLLRDGLADMPLSAYNPSTDWSQGGPFIERERIILVPKSFVGATESGQEICQPDGWAAYCRGTKPYWMTVEMYYGATPLIAAMRCFVAMKLGDRVEIPKELQCW